MNDITRAPQIGERVQIPRGLETIIGEVVQVYGPDGSPHAIVAVPIEGASGETLDTVTVSVPLDALSTVTDNAAT